MTTLNEAVENFLAQEKIAVAGVSRNGDAPANLIYRKLREAGYRVYAINPNAETVEGDRAYPTLSAVPETLDGVVIATRPQVTGQIVRDCAELGISKVWMHRSFGQGSVAVEAVEFCCEHDITVIAGGCPMMFCKPVDFGHKCMRWILNVSGGLPKNI
jgi:predicted CoA-binding protein